MKKIISMLFVLIMVVSVFTVTSQAATVEEGAGLIICKDGENIVDFCPTILTKIGNELYVFAPSIKHNGSYDYSFYQTVDGEDLKGYLSLVGYDSVTGMACFNVKMNSDNYAWTSIYPDNTKYIGNGYAVSFDYTAANSNDYYFSDLFDVYGVEIYNNDGMNFQVNSNGQFLSYYIPILNQDENGYFELVGFYYGGKNGFSSCLTVDSMIKYLGITLNGYTPQGSEPSTTQPDTTPSTEPSSSDTQSSTKVTTTKVTTTKKGGESNGKDDTKIWAIVLGVIGLAVLGFIIYRVFAKKGESNTFSFSGKNNGNNNFGPDPNMNNTQPMNYSGNDFNGSIDLGGTENGSTALYGSDTMDNIGSTVPMDVFNSTVINPPTQQSINPTQPIVNVKITGLGGYFDRRTVEKSREIIIGRDSKRCNCCYPIDEKGISSVHCKIVDCGEYGELTDLNSSYGTFINGEKLLPNMPYRISHGDTFYLADTNNSFKFE